MPDSNNFAYEAQTRLGQQISGTIVAASPEEARARLVEMGLGVLQLRAVGNVSQPTRRGIGRDDFLLFNEQLAHLTAAGLPIEKGLRFIAADVRSGRLAAAANDVAAELDRGVPLEQALQNHQARFPRLYAQVVAAGVKVGNLPALLLNLGRHMELVARLRQTIWRTLAYPMVVMLAFFGVTAIIVTQILPQMRDIFKDFRTSLPTLTEGLLLVGDNAGWLGGALLVVIGAVVVFFLFGFVPASAGFVERVKFGIPIIGRLLQCALLARWCDALRLGVEAGMDLPQALGLAGHAVTSPALEVESEELAAWITAGKPLQDFAGSRRIPATVPAAIDLGSKSGDLPATLATLTRLYQAQAEHRLRVLPIILTPLVTFALAGMLFTVIVGTFLPLIKITTSVMGE